MVRSSTRKYSEAQESQFRFTILDVLQESREAMTIDNIKAYQPMVFEGVSTQKMARILTNLCEMNLARKGKSKRLKRMVYKSTAVMQEEGYDVGEVMD